MVLNPETARAIPKIRFIWTEYGLLNLDRERHAPIVSDHHQAGETYSLPVLLLSSTTT